MWSGLKRQHMEKGAVICTGKRDITGEFDLFDVRQILKLILFCIAYTELEKNPSILLRLSCIYSAVEKVCAVNPSKYKKCSF